MAGVYFAAAADAAVHELAERFGLSRLNVPPLAGEYLLADAEGIALCRAGEKGRVLVDFAGGAAQYRRTKGGGELIGKAVNHRKQPEVWDATGGLGRDSFVLAGLGLTVRVFE